MLLDNSDLGIEQSVVQVLDWWQSKQAFPWPPPRCLRTGLVVQQLNPRENAHNRRN